MNTKTDSELIEEVEKRIHAREMDIRQIGEHLGCNEDELMNEMAQMLRWDYIALLTTTIARVRGERDAHWASEIKWLHHYMTLEKNEDAVRSILEDAEQALTSTKDEPTCDCHINLEKGKHWPGCVHYKKE